MKTTESLMDYDARTAPDKVAARNQHLATVRELYLRCEQDKAAFGELKVSIVNNMRAAGLELDQCVGERHEQLILTVGGLEFCRKHVLSQLPAGATVVWLQACVKLGRQMAAPAKTPAEADQHMKLVQMALGLAVASKKGVEELHGPRNLFSDVVNDAKKIDAWLRELETEKPIEHWPAQRLDSFLREFEPLYEKYGRALKARQGQ